MLVMAWLGACREPDTTPEDSTTTESTPPHSALVHTGVPLGHTGTTGTTGSTASTGHTGTVEFDCTTVSPTPVSVRPVPGGRGYHGLAFDQLGYMYGMDTGLNLVRTDFYGGSGVFLPNTGGTQGMDTLPSGELVVASDQGGIAIVDPATAGTRIIATNVNGVYGVDVGPDGLIYAGNRSNAYRVDPVTGDATVYIASSEAQSVGFSPDGTKFYFTKTFGYALWQVELDANYDPIAAPTQLSDFGGSYRDGLAVDICGNIYVTDYGTGKMFRTDPLTGVNIVYVNFTPFSNYGHGTMWGSGIGGWLTDAIYVPQPYNGYTVGEIVTGVPGAVYP